MSSLSFLAVTCLLSLSFSQTIPQFVSEEFFQVDTCLNYSTSGWSTMYKCVTVNGFQAVRQYVWEESLSCGGAESSTPTGGDSSYFSGKTYGGCDQDSSPRTLYLVENCQQASDNVADANGDECGYFQYTSTSDRLPLEQCRLNNCQTGENSCITDIDNSDGNFTLIETGYDSYDCTGNISSTYERDAEDESEVVDYNNGPRNCHVKVVEYSFSGTYMFCNYNRDRWSGPSGIIENPRYYYNNDADTTYVYAPDSFYDYGLITDVQPKVLGECFYYRQGFKEFSYMFECDDEASAVVAKVWIENTNCKGDEVNVDYYIWSSDPYSREGNYHNCDDATASTKTPRGTFNTKLRETRYLNPNAERSSGPVGGLACYRYYGNYEDLSYPEQNLRVVRSTSQGNNFLTRSWYFNGTCDTPLVTQWDVLDSESSPYSDYKISGIKNNKNRFSKKRSKKYLGTSSYYYYN